MVIQCFESGKEDLRKPNKMSSLLLLKADHVQRRRGVRERL
jgi:hypothetical protein